MKTLSLVLLCWCVATASLASDGLPVKKKGKAPAVSTQKVDGKASDEPVLIHIKDWDAIGCSDPDQIFVIRLFRTTREVKATCE